MSLVTAVQEFHSMNAHFLASWLLELNPSVSFRHPVTLLKTISPSYSHSMRWTDIHSQELVGIQVLQVKTAPKLCHFLQEKKQTKTKLKLNPRIAKEGVVSTPSTIVYKFSRNFFFSFSDALLGSCRGSFCTYLDVLYAVFAVTVN